jgi:GNAT superfamily N-acetyltransferase
LSFTTTLKASEDLSETDAEALRRLKHAVYPPGEPWPGATREWAGPMWGVLVRNDSGDLVSYTGVVQRNGRVDHRPVSIGGLGGIATHPDHRGNGYAPFGMGRALDFLAERGADFALLVCRDELVGYYRTLGWRLFEGELRITQHGEEEVFAFNRVMVGDLNEQAPRSGTIDLQGPPW